MAGMRRLRREVASGAPSARLRWYGQTMVWEWVAALVVLAWWAYAGRPLDALGITAPGGTGFIVCLGLSIATIVLFVVQARAAAREPERVARGLQGLDAIRGFLPHSEPELRRFYQVGLTAGIVEELIYRGFLMWYFASWAPIWVAIVASALVFGAGHLYQGVAGAVRVVAIGIVAGAVYWASGSIWIPMLLHAALDMVQGRMIFLALREPRAANA